MALPVIGVLVQSVILLEKTHTKSQLAKGLREKVATSQDFHKIAYQLQEERGRAASFIGRAHGQEVSERYRKSTNSTDSIIESTHIPDTFIINGSPTTKLELKLKIENIRQDVFHSGTTVEACLGNYTELIQGMLTLSRRLELSADSHVASISLLTSNAALLFAIDAFGFQKALGSRLYLECDISHERLVWLLHLRGEAFAYLSDAFYYDTSVLREYQKNRFIDSYDPFNVDLFGSINSTICEAASFDTRVENSLKGVGDLTAFINELITIETAQTKTIVETFDAKSSEAAQEFTIYVLSFVSVIIICIAISIWHSWSVTRMTRRLIMSAQQMSNKSYELNEEKLKSERLLYKMLPPYVAQRLKENQDILPEHYENSTIYFSNVVGFETISNRSSPLEIVNMLNSLFCVFDKCIDRYDVYKVETIGDAYMVVSGVPKCNGSRHVSEIAELSLSIRTDLSDFVIPHMDSERVQVRIGIHSGPVVAGIIGTKMPRYCLFGDSVNVASRMESSGVAMKIHISEDTHRMLLSIGGYNLQRRGMMNIKGKGTRCTYWLNGHYGKQEAEEDSTFEVIYACDVQE